MVRLLSITESDRPDKKLKAVFLQDNGRTTTTHFGQKNAPDYTLTKDKAQRERYIKRHSKDLRTNDPTRAGFLSMHILWGATTSIQANTHLYKTKYDL
jgi:hypothetical protein